MQELRWILLALGAAFCLGLWWWEARRGRQAADSRASLTPVDTFTSTSTTVVRDARAEVVLRDARAGDVARGARAEDNPARELPPWDATIAGEESDEAKPDAADTDEEGVPWSESPQSGMSRPASARAEGTSLVEATFDAPELDAIQRGPLIDIAAVRRSRLESGHPDAGFDVARGAARIEPTIGDAAAVVGRAADKRIDESAARQGAAAGEGGAGTQERGDGPEPDAGADRRVAARADSPGETKGDAAVDEKIVTLRVAAPPLERFEGKRLVGALRAAGLEHGKFSIFHKIAADGATLFSVASLVEPGTFDLDALDGRRLPGVSLFAVLRRNPESAALVEDMLGTARSLALTLHGTVQDERGMPLSPQRLAELRADVAAWVRRAGA